MEPDDSSARLMRFVRWSAIGLAIFLLLWLPAEDDSLMRVTLFGGALASLVGVWLYARTSPPSKTLWHPIGIGLLAGLVVAPFTMFLMIFKTGLHGHGTPDFTNYQILSTLARTPIWAVGGGLIGLGIGLAERGRWR